MSFTWKIIVMFAVMAMATVVLYLPLTSPVGIFNTPDENANYFFASPARGDNFLRVSEPLAGFTENAVHPRGVNMIGGYLVPESFLGLPILYGVIKSGLDNEWILMILVIALTIFALYALYQLFMVFFERRAARLAILLVLTLPVFLYWAGRPYMHTILFLDFLVLVWWLLIKDSPSSAGLSLARLLVGGVLLGLALAMRTSEVVWVGVGTIAIVLYNNVARGLIPYQGAHKVPRYWLTTIVMRFFKVGFGIALVLVPLLFLNQNLYGNFFGTGYSVSETNLIVEGAEVPQLTRVPLIQQMLLPFDFHPFEAVGRFVKYALGGMWWYAAPMMLGSLVASKQETRNKKQFIYSMIWIILSLYLIFVYGSFRAEIFADPMHPLASTIGAPYLRYWLPIFVFGAPFAAKFLIFIRNRIMNYESRIKANTFYILHFTFYILLVLLSLRAVVWAGPESWHGIQENLWQFAEARERVERATPEDAVFIVPRWADRIYFPARKVIVDVEGKDMLKIVRALAPQSVPVFWHRGRGEIKLEPYIYDAGFKLKRRFDIDPKGKIYEISNFQ